MVSNLFDIEEIKSQYNFKGEYYDFDILNNGHINNTYLLNFDYNGCEKSYVLQQINTAVFKNPEELMRNYVGVTDFVRKKVVEAGGNQKHHSAEQH